MKDEWIFGGGEAQKDITACAVCMHRGVAGRLGPCALGTGSVWRRERKREKCRGPALIPHSRASATSFPFCVPPTLPTRGSWSKAWALLLPKDQPLPPLLQEIIKTLPGCAPAPAYRLRERKVDGGLAFIPECFSLAIILQSVTLKGNMRVYFFLQFFSIPFALRHVGCWCFVLSSEVVT